MKKLAIAALGLCGLLSLGSNIGLAQSAAGVTSPPKVLVIVREYLKVNKTGADHAKTESAFAAAMAEAKAPGHYFAMNSISGVPRSLFFTGYDSFADWQKTQKEIGSNAKLSAALDRTTVADVDLLTSYDQSVWTFDPEYSLRVDGSIATFRYMELTVFKVKPGHRKEWTDLVNLYKSGMDKVPSAHWATFESAYGPDNDEFLVATALKSMADIDQENMDAKNFTDALGKDGMKKLSELTAECIESSTTSLFHFSPAMSYPPDEWVKEDAYWKPKVMVPVKKEAPKAAPAK
jgi:hypothetical protein